MRTLEEREKRERERREIVRDAVAAADRIILEGSDGSNEETNFLTSMVTEKMVYKTILPFVADMTKKDLVD